jgi:hypothetical protein
MEQSWALTKGRMLIVLSCLLFVGCGSAKRDPETVAEAVAHGIPLQSTPVQVLTYLDGQKIRHSPYERDTVKGNSIEAGIPYDPSKWELVYTSYGIVFRFDGHDRLIATAVHPQYTGP